MALRKNLSIEKGEPVLLEDIRYFFANSASSTSPTGRI